MAAQPVTFEVEGVQFELKRLNVDDTCAGLELLMKALGPVMAADGESNWLTCALSQASCIPALLKLFAPVTKVSRKPDGSFEAGGSMVDLKPFVNDCFAGRHVLMLAFLGKAVQNEYRGFFAEAVRLAELLALPSS